MYLAGLYHSIQHNSQSFISRVRIPNYAMLRINRTGGDTKDEIMKRTFYFNYTEGLWEERIETTNFVVRTIMGIHAYYSRTFFQAIDVIKKSQAQTTFQVLNFPISQYHTRELDDDKFYEDFNLNGNIAKVEPLSANEGQGAGGNERRMTVQQPADQSESEVVLFTNSILLSASQKPSDTGAMPVYFQPNQQESRTLLFQTTGYARNRESVLKEYIEFNNQMNNFQSLLEKHRTLWKYRWDRGDIEFKGSGQNFGKVRHTAKMALYHIYCQFPFKDRFTFGNEQSNGGTMNKNEDAGFFGVSATGLGRGGNSSRTAKVDFAGHITPDQELYLFPTLAFLQPDLAKQILYYRARNINQQPPVPFESAKSGLAVEPLNCMQCKQESLYPSGALGLAIRLYHTMTMDQTWLEEQTTGGLAMIEKIARYFDQKIMLNSTRAGGWYSISGATGTDKLHNGQTNNFMTNTLAIKAIHYYHYLRCINNQPYDQTVEDMLYKARKIYFPHQWENGEIKNEEFEGYLPGRTPISEPDMLLSYFPIGFNMSGRWLEQARPDMLQRDRDTYGNNFVQGQPIPCVHHALDTILTLQDPTKVSEGPNKYQTMISECVSSPFYQWRNSSNMGYGNTINEISAAGHIATAASYLSTLIFGFGGLRIQSDRLDILQPSLPPDVTEMTIKGLHFYGGEMDYTVTNQMTISFSQTSGGTGFSTQMKSYNREKNQWNSFSGSANWQYEQYKGSTNARDVDARALFSIIRDVNMHCPLRDYNYNSHNVYFQGSSVTIPSFVTLAMGIAAAVLHRLVL